MTKDAIWRDRIVKDPLILAGKPTVKGTRISVELIVELLDGGRSEADIIRMYSHITPEDIRACREYAATGAKLSNVTWADIDAMMERKENPEMAMATISIQVDEEAAKAYTEVSPQERRKIECLLRLRLQDLTLRPRRSLKAVMDEIGQQAEARGLTPELLESLLDDE